MDKTNLKISDITEKIKKTLSSKSQGNIIVTLGLTGLVLIAISGFFKSNPSKEKTLTTSNSISNRQQELKQNLENIISEVEGAGKARVMVTFENSTETVYATEERKNKEACEDKSEGMITRKKESNDCEKKYITIKDSQEIEPKVKGVIVICSGGDNPIVKQRITEAVTTALNIPSKRVCITKSG